MSGYIIKSKEPIIAEKKLSRTPATEINQEITNYIKMRRFTFNINSETGEIRHYAKKK